jgi:hypothetical protein
MYTIEFPETHLQLRIFDAIKSDYSALIFFNYITLFIQNIF